MNRCKTCNLAENTPKRVMPRIENVEEIDREDIEFAFEMLRKELFPRNNEIGEK